MGHTNSTPNFSLPQFLANDKPAWLTDINGAFSTIDTNMQNIKTTAQDNGTNITALTNRINTLEPIVAQHSTSIEQLQTSTVLNANNISSLTDQIDRIKFTNYSLTPESGFTYRANNVRYSIDLSCIYFILRFTSASTIAPNTLTTIGTLNAIPVQFPTFSCTITSGNTSSVISKIIGINGAIKIYSDINLPAGTEIQIDTFFIPVGTR